MLSKLSCPDKPLLGVALKPRMFDGRCCHSRQRGKTSDIGQTKTQCGELSEAESAVLYPLRTAQGTRRMHSIGSLTLDVVAEQ
jgi:hypothetical protein